MRSSSLAILFAGATAAQSTVTLFNVFVEPTLTLKSSDSTATTYEKVCSSSANNRPTAALTTLEPSGSTSESSLGGDHDLSFIPITSVPFTPATTPRARIRRQSLEDEGDFCEPYTLIQGASTWEFHLTDPVPGAWTLDGHCDWRGELTTADVACTLTQNGNIVSEQGVSTTTFDPSAMSLFGALNPVAIVSTTGGGSTTPTPSGSPTTPASGNAAKSTGLAPPRPLPTGAIVFIGGAAGLFAAALTL